MGRTAALEILPGIWRIPTLGRDVINSFALVEPDDSVTLIDCGFGFAPPRIVAALAVMKKRPSDVNRIVLTHAHPDHSGGTADMVARTGAKVALHEAEVAWAQAGQALQKSDPSHWSGRLYNRSTEQRFHAFDVATVLQDGDIVAGSGLRAIHTPGHSPGHLALLHGQTGTLFTGDAMMNFRYFGMGLPARALCSDFTLTEQSAQTFADLDYAHAAFTHGPQIIDRGRQEIRRFLAKLR